MANNFAKLRGLSAIKNGFDDIRNRWGEPATWEAYADADHAAKRMPHCFARS